MKWNVSMCWLYAITKYHYVPSIKQILAAIDDAQRLGFEYMELEGVGPQLYTVAENKAKIKKTCEEKDIQLIDFVPVLPNTMSTDEKKRKRALEDKDFKFAYTPPSIAVDPKFDFWKFFNDILVSSIAECNDMAEEHGLKLCIEPRTWENISNAWALEAHLAAQKMPPVQCVEMLGNRIFYVHASDNDFLTEDHLEVGTGKVDWENLLKALQKHGFEGFIGIDIGGKKELKPQLDSMYVNSKNYLEKMMNKLSKAENP